MAQRRRIAEDLVDARQRPDDGAVGVAARVALADADQDVEHRGGQVALVEQWRARRQQAPLEHGHVLHRLPAVQSLGPAPALRRQRTLRASKSNSPSIL